VLVIRNGYTAFHLSGEKADAAFALQHRPLEETIADALAWFRKAARYCPLERSTVGSICHR